MNAPGGVPATAELTTWYLPFEGVNRANDVAHKLRSVLECIRSASLSRDEPSEGAIAGACWLACDLIDELEAIATMRQPQKAAQSAVGA